MCGSWRSVVARRTITLMGINSEKEEAPSRLRPRGLGVKSGIAPESFSSHPKWSGSSGRFFPYANRYAVCLVSPIFLICLFVRIFPIIPIILVKRFVVAPRLRPRTGQR